MLASAPMVPAAAQLLCLADTLDRPVAGDGEQRLIITAGQINRLGEDRIEFEGDIEFRYGKRSVSAEQASFDLRTQTAQVHGSVTYRDGQVTVYGNDAEVDTRGRVITFAGGGFDLPLRAARGGAETIRIRDDNTIALETVNFTTCLSDPPDWELLARELEMDVDAGSGTARGFRLRFKGVPVLGSPYVTFPLDDRRKSGLLTPSFSNRARTGLDVSLPVYVNLAPNYDLTFTTRYMRERGAQGNAELRYLLPGTEGQLRLEYLPEDARLGFSRSYLGYTNDTNLGRDWRIFTDLQEVSDPFYFEDMHNSLSAASQTHLNRTVELSYRAPRWSLLARVQNFQTIDPFIVSPDEPYQRMPQVLLRGNWRKRIVRFSSHNELVNFERRVGMTGWRLDLEEELSLALTRPGMFLRPAIALRQTNYWLNEVTENPYSLAGGETQYSRTLPVGSLDAGLTFERTAPAGGWVQTIEPRALYVRIPFEEQRHLPVFDTAEPTFNFVQLFHKYRYLGADRIADTNQFSVGVTTRLIDLETGRERLSGTIGQTRYLSAQRVTLHDKSLALGSASDYIAELTMSLRPTWRVGLDYQWDSEATEISRTEGRFEFRPRQDRMLGVAYRYQENVLQQGDISLAWPLGDAWKVVARASYSFLDEKPLERFLGWEYASCCWRLQVYGRDYVSRRTGETDRSLTVQFLLRGFTDPGESAESMLERGILGYRRFDDLP